jgi:5-bromo-4-chloroindolyl phosphate hydrolysis protein
MNADHKVITPEQRWHAGRQAEAFFSLLDKHDKLMQEYLKLSEEMKKLKKLNKSLAAAAPKPPTP